MRYPWVCLSICGVWVATFIVILFKIVEPTVLYIEATITVLIVFFLGFTRS